MSWKQNLLSGKQDCLPIKLETVLLRKECFRDCPGHNDLELNMTINSLHAQIYRMAQYV